MPAQSDQSLVCPSCGRVYSEQERFCSDCRMPLVRDPDEVTLAPLTERQERARKIKPQLAEGPLVRVAGARNLAEAEFIQALLLEEGVPSLLRRTAGFDVPDFLAAGPRDILVPQAGAGTAREVLLQAEIISAERPPSGVAPGRVLVGLLIALAVGLFLVWLAVQALR
jgi:hypothetical protein